MVGWRRGTKASRRTMMQAPLISARSKARRDLHEANQRLLEVIAKYMNLRENGLLTATEALDKIKELFHAIDLEDQMIFREQTKGYEAP